MVNNFSRIVLNNKGTISPLIIPDSSIKGTGLCNTSIFIDDGEILAGNTVEDRIKLFEKVAKLGTWTGGNWEIRRRAKKDAFKFISKIFD